MKRPISKILLGCLMALPFGMFLPYLFIAPIFAMFLYSFGGIIPFALMSLMTALSGYLTGGKMLSLMFISAYVLPSALGVVWYSGKKPFNYRIKGSIIACLFGAFLAIGIAYAFVRQDLIAVLVENLKTTAQSIGSDYIESLLAMTIGTGEITASTGAIMTTAEKFNLLMETYLEALPLVAPGFLLSVSLVNGLLMTLWSSYAGMKYGAEIEYVPVSEWKVPRSIFGYLYVTLILVVLWNLLKFPAADELFTTTVIVFSTIVTIKAVTSILCRMRKSGASPAKRTVLIILGLTLASQFLSIYGILSSLFGSDGLIKVFLKKRAEKRNKEDQQ